jgi:hypothetical protein
LFLFFLFLKTGTPKDKTKTLYPTVTHYLGPIAQLDRASDFESEGWAFESLWDRHP